MQEHVATAVATVVAVGVGAQWLAARARLPSILLLLLAGLLLGPGLGLIRPDTIFGDILLPVASLPVALILFEGGLSLRVAELRGTGAVVRRLVTGGALVTWGVAGLSAHLLLGLDPGLSLLLGAILVVSGPTVVMPLMRHVRPTGKVASILKWEGIVIDPVGVLLAVLVLEAILARSAEERVSVVVAGVIGTTLVGGAIGVLAAGLVYATIRRYWAPEHLQSALTTGIVLGSFVLANEVRAESGLFAVTFMGFALGNQVRVSVRSILHFKEDLNVILLSGLFVILAARIKPEDLTTLSVASLPFLAVLVFVGRPLAVAVATVGSPLSLRERAFLAAVAPRGIVAASISSIFELRLARAGVPGAEQLVPLTFLVIVGTVCIYGLGARPLARRLGLGAGERHRVVLVGASRWVRALARALKDGGVSVLLVDNNWAHVSAAKLEGLDTVFASILSDRTGERLEMGGVGRLLALTPNDEVNTLAVTRFGDELDRREIFQLPAAHGGDPKRETAPRHLRARTLFGEEMTYEEIERRIDQGAVFKTNELTDTFDFDAFRALYGDRAVPLFVLDEGKPPEPFATDSPPSPRPGQCLVSLVSPER